MREEENRIDILPTQNADAKRKTIIGNVINDTSCIENWDRISYDICN